MKIGLTYDLKEDVPLNQSQPEDALEEYDSMETVAAIAATVESLGHSVVWIGGGREFLTNILRESVHLVFNIAEGLGSYRSREAQVPSVLEMLDIPYSGSDPQCLTICLDKPLTKRIVTTASVCTPKWQVIANSRGFGEISWEGSPFPAIVKPAYEGSSKGIRLGSLVHNPEQATTVAVQLSACYRQPVMVEEFIAGDEVTVGVVGNSRPVILGMMRVLPKNREPYFVYSLEVKRDWERLVDYECPAKLETGTLQKIEDSALKVFKVLGCRDFARLDFRVSSDGTPYFLEINPLAGLNPKSGDLVIMAKKMGWTYEDLIAAILDAALERYPQCVRR